MSSIPILRHPRLVLLALLALATLLWLSVPSAGTVPDLSWSRLGRPVWLGTAELREPIVKAHIHEQGVLRQAEPTVKFRDNLLPERAYITSGHSFGSSNQLITHIKMIALAARLDRIPIVDSFFGGDHGEGSEIRVSEFYDLSRLSETLSLPIVEWDDVKRSDSPDEEALVCWQGYVGDVAPNALRPFNIKVSFWPIPQFAFDTELPTLTSLEVLALKPPNATYGGGPMFALLRDELRSRGREPPASLPDQHLLCFDQFFWVLDGAFTNGRLDNAEGIEEPSELGRSWREVGRHLHYTAAFAALRDEFVARVLGRAGADYIAVHIRQGDFFWYNRVVDRVDVPFAEAVEEVRAELDGRRVGGRWRRQLPVVFGTDSEDKDFIASLEAKGWHYLDHDKFGTVERFGKWYKSMLDLAVMSDAIGFVGTEMSSFSGLAKNRVISWRGGVTRMTGKPAAAQEA